MAQERLTTRLLVRFHVLIVVAMVALAIELEWVVEPEPKLGRIIR
jgi:hypothetical protein